MSHYTQYLCSILVIWLVLLAALEVSVGADEYSYLRSDLGSEGGRDDDLDLVAGVSQVSVANVMTAFLKDIELEPTRYFLRRLGNEWVYTSYEQGIEDLGFDPFLIPNGTLCEDSENLQKADDLRYWMGFTATYGIPDVPESSLVCPIAFNLQGTSVTYNMYMKQFTAYEIDYSRDIDDCFMIRCDQDEWIAEDPEKNTAFRWQMKVDLYLREDSVENAWNDLPDETKHLIEDIGVGMFSIEQLVLNLNTAELINEHQIELPNIDKHTDLYTFLTRDFLRRYIEIMAEEGDGILFGYTVGAIEPPKHDPTIIPTDLAFFLSPHLDENGDISSKYDLYTLNYLMASEENSLPAPNRFKWNWISDGEQDKYDGVMCIRRDLLSERFNKQIREEMGERLCYIPSVTISKCGDNIGSGGIFVIYDSTIKVCPELQSYTIEDGENNLVMSWESGDKSEGECNTPKGSYFTAKLATNSSSQVYYEESSIRINCMIHIEYHETCSIDTSETRAVIHLESISIYDLEVSSDGVISAKLREPEKVKDLSSVVKADEIHGCGLQNFDKIVERIDEIADDLEDMLAGYEDSLSTILNGPSILVFPGAETFTFEDVRFSYYGDMLSRIRYNPDYSRAECINPADVP